MARALSEQVVVITGGSSGIGLCTARLLASRGARVVLTARNAKALETIVSEIEEQGGQALAVPGDVTREKDMRKVVKRAVRRFGRIDTWINNAAVFIQGNVDDIELEEYRRVIDVNLLGYINGTRQVLPQMRRQGHGTIIMISSILADRAAGFFSAYAASKAGVDGFSEALRVELWDTDITVSTMYLPTVDTPIYHHARGKFGTIPKPPPIVVEPEIVAEKLAKLVEKPRLKSSFGLMSTVFGGIGFLPVPMADWIFHLMASFTRTDIKDRGDNLDAPIKETPRVRGGWMEWGWRGLKASEVARTFPWVILAGAAGAGLLVLKATGPAGRNGAKVRGDEGAKVRGDEEAKVRGDEEEARAERGPGDAAAWEPEPWEPEVHAEPWPDPEALFRSERAHPHSPLRPPEDDPV